jgi:hypothetical protein
VSNRSQKIRMGIEMNENDTTVTKPMASSKSRAFIV